MSKARGLADLGNAYSDGALSNRNLIINGAMQVAQRGTSETGVANALYHTVDRFVLNTKTGATWTATQESDAPSGFSKSFKHEVTSANASPDASYYAVIQHRLEGQNVQSIAKGTADAKSLTVSFWVKSNVTGTYRFALLDVDNTRTIGATYSVSSSGAWEYKTITFDPDTTGVLDADASESLSLDWWISSGTDWSSGATPTSWEATVIADRNAGSSVNVAGAVSNYFQLTGVQLEVGDTATPFEHRSYGDELARCQRYFQRFDSSASTSTEFGIGAAYDGSYAIAPIFLKPFMRVAPTASASGTFHFSGSTTNVITSIVFGTASEHSIRFRGYSASSFSNNAAYRLRDGGSGDAVIELDAEL